MGIYKIVETEGLDDYGAPQYTINGAGGDTFTVKTSDSKGFSATVVNPLKPFIPVGTTSITGTKTWDDAGNQDGKRPESITVNLFANGEKVTIKEVTAADDWKYEFTNLDQYKDGQEIVYTITENPVTNYTTEVTRTNIKNSYTPGKTSITVTKSWNDSNNQDGLRPDSIQVQLYANGKAKGNTITLTKDMDWRYIWKDLDMKASGKEIEYTVKEVSTPKGYTSEVTLDKSGNIIITNTHTVNKKTPVTSTTGGTNNSGSLPKTGSDSGNLLEAIGVIILTALAGLFLFHQKRKA